MAKKKAKPAAEKKTRAPKAARPTVVLIDFDCDQMFEMAVRVLVEEGKVSTALLQRRLKIGYSRAAKLLDLLDEYKVIGPADGAKPRLRLGKASSVSVKRKPAATIETKVEKKGGPGRPSKYSDALVLKICTRLAHGQSLRQILRDEDLPCASTFFDWMMDESKTYLHKLYERSRELQAEVLFDETLEICDDGTNDWYDHELDNGHVIRRFDHEHAQRSKLRVDTRKWFISKVLPKKYGEKLDLTSLGKRIAEPRRAVINYVVPKAPAKTV